LKIVGHGFASKRHIYKASARMPTNGLESHAHTAALSLPCPAHVTCQSLRGACWQQLQSGHLTPPLPPLV
jgi:hypothetical protein